MINKKNIRYYFWLVDAFFKKYLYLIFLSFFISFLIVVFFISLSPYINTLLIKQNVVGVVGRYTLNNPPEEITKKISNGLLTVNEKGRIISVIAKSWEEKDNGYRYRFYLRDNLFWSDGKKFTAYDINYKFNDVDIQVINEKTIDFILKKPLAIFPIYLDKPIIKYPLKGLVGYYNVSKIKQEGGYLKEIILVPNIKDLNSIKYKFYLNESQLIAAYKKGEIKSMTLTKKSLAESFSTWKNTVVEKKVDYTKLLTIFFNFKNSYLQNKDVRQSFSLILNDDKLSQYGLPAKESIPPTSWAYNNDLKTRVYDFEIAEKFFSLNKPATNEGELNFVTFFDYYDVADEIVLEMKKIGLNTNLKIISQYNSDFDFFMAYLKIPQDPDQYYFWHSTQTNSNLGRYINMKVDLLLEKGRSTLNLEERKKYYLDFQKAIQEDPPALFLFYPYVYEIKRK